MHGNSGPAQALTKPVLPGAGPESGYANTPVVKVPDWYGMIACDALLNGMATGLFMTAAVSELVVPAVFAPVAKVAYLVALVLLLVDLGMLVLDLGDPLRFHHMLRVFKPTSPMSLGTWCLTVYSLPLTVAAALSLLPAEWSSFEWVRKAAVVLAILPALGSALYKGVLLSTTAQPGWRDARWLGCYQTNSALLLGCAEMLALSVLLRQESATPILRLALALLLVLNVVPLSLLVANLRPALVRIYTPRQLARLAALCIGGGILVPLGLLLAGLSPLLLLLAVLLLLLGSLALRFLIVRLPHASV